MSMAFYKKMIDKPMDHSGLRTIGIAFFSEQIVGNIEKKVREYLPADYKGNPGVKEFIRALDHKGFRDYLGKELVGVYALRRIFQDRGFVKSLEKTIEDYTNRRGITFEASE